MPAVEEVYLPDPQLVELWPFEDRVLEIIRLFRERPVVRIRIVGTIAGGEPIEAIEGPGDYIEVPGPDVMVRTHPALHALRRYLCPSLLSVSSDAFEVARIITPLLVGLKLAGRVDINLDPWLLAGIALIVERMGVAAFCADEEQSDPDCAQPAPHSAPAGPRATAARRHGASGAERERERQRSRTKARARAGKRRR